MTIREHQASNEVPGQLWTIAEQVRGMGQLFAMASGEPPVTEDGLKGISYLLLALADQIDAAREAIESQ